LSRTISFLCSLVVRLMTESIKEKQPSIGDMVKCKNVA